MIRLKYTEHLLREAENKMEYTAKERAQAEDRVHGALEDKRKIADEAQVSKSEILSHIKDEQNVINDIAEKIQKEQIAHNQAMAVLTNRISLLKETHESELQAKDEMETKLAQKKVELENITVERDNDIEEIKKQAKDARQRMETIDKASKKYKKEIGNIKKKISGIETTIKDKNALEELHKIFGTEEKSDAPTSDDEEEKSKIEKKEVIAPASPTPTAKANGTKKPEIVVQKGKGGNRTPTPTGGTKSPKSGKSSSLGNRKETSSPTPKKKEEEPKVSKLSVNSTAKRPPSAGKGPRTPKGSQSVVSMDAGSILNSDVKLPPLHPPSKGSVTTGRPAIDTKSSLLDSPKVSPSNRTSK